MKRTCIAVVLLLCCLTTHLMCSRQHSDSGSEQGPDRIVLFIDSAHNVTDSWICDVSSIFESSVRVPDSIIIDDRNSLEEFRVLYKRMADSCRVDSVQSYYGQSIIRMLVAEYHDHTDTLSFASLSPDGYISLNKDIYIDSLMYYYTVYQIAARDSAFRKEEMAQRVLQDIGYNYMGVSARDRYYKRINIPRSKSDNVNVANNPIPVTPPDSLTIHYHNKAISSSDYVSYKPNIFNRSNHSSITIRDSEVLPVFGFLYKRMLNDCLVCQDERPQDNVQLIGIEIKYRNFTDSLVFISYRPDGDIEVNNRVYTDSLMYYYTLYLISDRDDQFRNLRSKRSLINSFPPLRRFNFMGEKERRQVLDKISELMELSKKGSQAALKR